MTNQLQFIHDYCDFSNPNLVWMMKGISRNKDNKSGVTSGVRFFARRVIAKPEDIDICYDDIKILTNDPDTYYRLYISLNARNVIEGAFQFQKKLIDIGMGLAKGHEDALNMSKKVGSLWKTELEQTKCRGTKRFLLDIDNDSGVKANQILDYIHSSVKTIVHVFRKTVSGYVIVFNACDTRQLMIHCKDIGAEADLQRDSMVFVEQWKGKL